VDSQARHAVLAAASWHAVQPALVMLYTIM
jgi:hypothetical protein